MEKRTTDTADTFTPIADTEPVLLSEEETLADRERETAASLGKRQEKQRLRQQQKRERDYDRRLTGQERHLYRAQNARRRQRIKRFVQHNPIGRLLDRVFGVFSALPAETRFGFWTVFSLLTLISVVISNQFLYTNFIYAAVCLPLSFLLAVISGLIAYHSGSAFRTYRLRKWFCCEILGSVAVFEERPARRFRLASAPLLVGMLLGALLGSCSLLLPYFDRNGAITAFVLGEFKLEPYITEVLISPLAVMALLVVAEILIACYHAPELGLSLSVLLIPFSPLMRSADHPHLHTLVLLVPLLIALGGYLHKLLLGKRSFHLTALSYPVLLMMGFYAVYSVLGFSGIFGTLKSAEWALIYLGLSLAFILAQNLLQTRKQITAILRLLLFSAFVTACVALLEYWKFRGTPPDPSTLDISSNFAKMVTYRVITFFGNSNSAAVYFATVLPLGLWLLVTANKGLWRLFYFLQCVAVSAALVLTFSRGAWVGVGVALLLLLILLARKPARILAAILALLPAAVSVLPAALMSRMAGVKAVVMRLADKISKYAFLWRMNLRETTTGPLLDSSFSCRLTIWENSVRILSDNLLFGLGAGTSAFRTAYAKYAADTTVNVMHAHNLYLEITAEMGILFLAIFLWAIFQAIRMVTNRKFTGNSRLFEESQQGMKLSADSTGAVAGAALAALFAMLVNGFFDYVWYENGNLLLFWCVLGVISAAVRIEKENINRLREQKDSKQDSASFTAPLKRR